MTAEKLPLLMSFPSACRLTGQAARSARALDGSRSRAGGVKQHLAAPGVFPLADALDHDDVVFRRPHRGVALLLHVRPAHEVDLHDRFLGPDTALRALGGGL